MGQALAGFQSLRQTNMYKHIFVSDRKIQRGILSDFGLKTQKPDRF